MNAPIALAKTVVAAPVTPTFVSPSLAAPNLTLAAPSLNVAGPGLTVSPALTPMAALQGAVLPAPAKNIDTGRATFDGGLAKTHAEAVPLALHPVKPLSAPSTALYKAAAAVPAAPLAAASAPGEGIFIALGIAAVILVLLNIRMALSRPVRRRPVAAIPDGPAATDLASLREQTNALTEELIASVAVARDPRKASTALSDAWYRVQADGGVAVITPEGTVKGVRIAPEVFAAIDLPGVLRQLSGRLDQSERWFDAVRDVLRGLPLEAERAKDAADLYERLGWFKRHFEQFPR